MPLQKAAVTFSTSRLRRRSCCPIMQPARRKGIQRSMRFRGLAISNPSHALFLAASMMTAMVLQVITLPVRGGAAPAPKFVLSLPVELAAAPAPKAKQRATNPGGFSWAIPGRREDSRLFYNAVYEASSVGQPMRWTGSLKACKAGASAGEYLTAALRRINFFRALAGVPAAIRFLPQFNALAQKAAVMMLANRNLSHFPPPSWRCYTADGAAAAGTSNLFLGDAGARSVDGYMNDHGIASLGHRRWIVYPPIQNMGQGNVDGGGGFGASALYLDHVNLTSARTRDPFVAWPPRGFIPYSLVPPDWSFALAHADFSLASVKLLRGRTALPLAVMRLADYYGDNAIGFSPLVPLPSSGRDSRFTVRISNVLVGGGKKAFSYDVIAFDLAVRDSSSQETRIIRGPTRVKARLSGVYMFSKLSCKHVDGYEYQVFKTVPYTGLEGAEKGLAAFDVATSGYKPTSSSVFKSGKASFHLAHTLPEPQTLTFKSHFFIPSRASKVTFASRLGCATPGQFAQVQVSLNQGVTWQKVYSQPGNGCWGEESFASRTVSLSAFAGRSIVLRFAYVYDASLGFPLYTENSTGIGWYIDDIKLVGFLKAFAPTGGRAAGTSFRVSFLERSRYIVQVRATAFGHYALDWGPGYMVVAL